MVVQGWALGEFRDKRAHFSLKERTVQSGEMAPGHTRVCLSSAPRPGPNRLPPVPLLRAEPVSDPGNGDLHKACPLPSQGWRSNWRDRHINRQWQALEQRREQFPKSLLHAAGRTPLPWAHPTLSLRLPRTAQRYHVAVLSRMHRPGAPQMDGWMDGNPSRAPTEAATLFDMVRNTFLDAATV